MSDHRFTGVIGDDYDLFKLAVPHHDDLQDMLAATVKYVASRSKAETITILEIGCGRGETSRRLLGTDPRVHLIAIDNEDKMLSAARQNLSAYSSRVTFKSDIAQSITPLRGNWFGERRIDVVASAYTLHNFQREYRIWIMRLIQMNLRTGGLFVNADKYAQDSMAGHWQDLKAQIDAFAVFDDIGRPDLREEWTKHYLEDEQTRRSEGNERELLAYLGFKNIRTVYRSGMEAVIAGNMG